MEASARKDNNPVAIDVSGVQTWKVVRGGEVDDCRAAREQHFRGTPLSRNAASQDHGKRWNRDIKQEKGGSFNDGFHREVLYTPQKVHPRIPRRPTRREVQRHCPK